MIWHSIRIQIAQNVTCLVTANLVHIHADTMVISHVWHNSSPALIQCDVLMLVSILTIQCVLHFVGQFEIEIGESECVWCFRLYLFYCRPVFPAQ